MTTPLVQESREQARVRQRQRRVRQQMLRRRRRAVVLAMLAVATLLVGVDLVRGAERVAAPDPGASGAPSAGGPVGDAAATPTGPAAQGPAGKPVTVPARGTGTFAIAPGGTEPAGGGRLMRYQVRVEDGIGQVAGRFAAAVDATLADPRSWTRGGAWAFQRVTGGSPDLVITLASPETVDRLCHPLDTNGYTSCRVDNQVVINLARWLLAVPEFEGDLATYRLYVINHEVGHRLGNGHTACPGGGRLAPVMQQQTLGLKGCRPNPWPYVEGRLLTGPAVP